jgi:peroxiredoxin
VSSQGLRTVVFVVVAAVLGAAAGIGGFVGYQHYSERTEPAHRPAFELPDLDGQLQSVSQWDGKVLALNFWASWCPPCVREIPAFIQLQEKYGERGVQFVGVAIDRAEAAREFAQKLGINYPLLYGVQSAMEISEQYGNFNGTLPYTVLIDRNGVIVNVFAYEVDHETMERALQELL